MSEKTWIISDLTIGENKIVFRQLRGDRVVATRKILQLRSGRWLVEGSKGQFYVDFQEHRAHGRTEFEIKPGTTGLGVAEGLMKMGHITPMQFADYSEICHAASADRALRKAGFELQEAADTLGIKLSSTIKRRIAKVTA